MKFKSIDLGYNPFEVARDAEVVSICNSCGKEVTELHDGKCKKCFDNNEPCRIDDNGKFPWEYTTVGI